MLEIILRIEDRARGAEIFESGQKDVFRKFKDRLGIVSPGNTWPYNSIGFSEKEKKWYGWSHRAAVGFGVGDRIFDENYGDDNTPFDKHGKMVIRDMEDAKKSAINFARYVS